MTKNNQTPITVSLELAKKMKELGRNKPTHFWYVGYEGCMDQNHSQEPMPLHDDLKHMRNSPTAQEILDELPDQIMDDGTCFRIQITKWKSYHETEYINRHISAIPTSLKFMKGGANLAEALGELRCRCKENGYIE